MRYIEDRNRPRRGRRAVAAVEFAIVAPLFFLLFFGMLEFGRMMMVQQVLTSAAREGARVGTFNGRTTAQVTSAVNGYLAGASVTGASVTVSPDLPSSAPQGTPITVTVAVPFDRVSWLPKPWFLGGKSLRAVATMRREGLQ
jgi:Flp pilus assembly protein TadG